MAEARPIPAEHADPAPRPPPMGPAPEHSAEELWTARLDALTAALYDGLDLKPDPGDFET